MTLCALYASGLYCIGIVLSVVSGQKKELFAGYNLLLCVGVSRPYNLNHRWNQFDLEGGGSPLHLQNFH